MKKGLLIIVISVLLGGGLYFLTRPKPTSESEVKKVEKPTVTMIEELPEVDRPVISLTARPDGKELTLKMANLKNFKTIEYELVYLTEGIQRGVIGSVDLKKGEDSITRKLLLGTCSRGVCRYDKNVTGGTLTITFRNEKTYKYVKDFKLEKQKGKIVVVMG